MGLRRYSNLSLDRNTAGDAPVYAATIPEDDDLRGRADTHPREIPSLLTEHVAEGVPESESGYVTHIREDIGCVPTRDVSVVTRCMTHLPAPVDPEDMCRGHMSRGNDLPRGHVGENGCADKFGAATCVLNAHGATQAWEGAVVIDHHLAPVCGTQPVDASHVVCPIAARDIHLLGITTLVNMDVPTCLLGKIGMGRLHVEDEDCTSSFLQSDHGHGLTDADSQGTLGGESSLEKRPTTDRTDGVG